MNWLWQSSYHAAAMVWEHSRRLVSVLKPQKQLQWQSGDGI